MGKISEETEAGSSGERGVASSVGKAVGEAQDAMSVIVKIKNRIFCTGGL